jgi:hypothetical protein
MSDNPSVSIFTCQCGYEASSAEDFIDHFGAEGIPHDDIAPDGQAHAEAAVGPPGQRCLCGFIAGPGPDLDAHLIAIFTAPGVVGRDGQAHG